MRKVLILLLALALAFGQAFAGQRVAFASQTLSPVQTTSGDSQDDSTIKVDVKLVNIFATVTTQSGAPVSTLKKEDFQILEDGIPQKIAVFDRESTLPLSIVLAIDASLSTSGDLKFELESARRFVRATLDPIRHDALSLYKFSEIVDEMIPFTSDFKRIDHAIDRVHVGTATALYDAIYLGADALANRQGRKVMVVITDGGDTLSKVSYDDALRAAQQSEAIIYPIIIVPIEASAGRNLGGEHALIQLSRDTGGKYYYADSTRQLDEVFRQISAELRTQYLLAYYPSRRLADSDYRQIEVRISPSGTGSNDPLIVRNRTGYYTSKFK